MELLSKPLWDRYIDVKFYIGEKLFYSLKTPEHGLKPNIRFSWSRVPGNFTYNCKLEVINLFISESWYDVTHIEVEAGYFKASKQSFSCHVFSTYRPDAGPDSSTVFECIVASATAGLMDAQPYILKIVKEGYTVESTLKGIAKQMSMKCCTYLDPAIYSMPFSEQSIEESFSNGYQLWNYVYANLAGKAKSRGCTLQLIVFDKEIIFFMKDATGKLVTGQAHTAEGEQKGLEIPALLNVLDATYTSGTLTVTAPWTPNIYPGAVFYADPQRYTGSKAFPNMVRAQGTYKDETNLFYVITQDVVFETTGNRNQMKLLAVKASNSPQGSLQEIWKVGKDEDAKAEIGYKELAKKIAENYSEKFKQKLEIRLGDSDEPTRLIEAQAGRPKIPDEWGAGFEGNSQTDDYVKKQSSITQIAGRYFKSMPSMKYVMGSRTPTILAGDPHNQFIGTCLILLSTYKHYLEDIDKNKDFKLSIYQWHNMPEYQALRIPSISDWKSLMKDSRVSNMCRWLSKDCYRLGLSNWGRIYAMYADIIDNAEILN